LAVAMADALHEHYIAWSKQAERTKG
jgi:hypothetical protein